ncbi:MAG: amylo-alpha-1,6-glucosidase [Chlamydiae bacterium]|nr:amylo-alpha-1,6-glucosidase [Chlamydiota bacterium]MBI3276457.1 amylo-alpha-1,6-glucosidase [Chlamydiota bacterium]
MIAFHKEILKNYDRASKREWVVTNGLGGYASSTICGANTRRYHGLLVASIEPPTNRMVILSKVEETIHIDGKSYDLSCNKFPETIHPMGHQHLELFSFEFYPKFIYSVDGVRLEKNVYMIFEKNATIIFYRLLESPKPIKLSLMSFVACRRFHELTHENPFFNPKVECQEGLLRLKPYKNAPMIHFFFSPAQFADNPLWYQNFEYEKEYRRGLDYREDLFTPGDLTFDIAPGGSCFLIVSTDELSSSDLLQAEFKETERKKLILKNCNKDDKLAFSLFLAADTFLVQRGEKGSASVIGGYHWFSDWGRDTMISLPGLTLATGRFDLAKSILTTYSKYCSQGMLPNRFPDEGKEPDYNTVDATLWFFNAIYQYFLYTGDEIFIRSTLFPVLKDMIHWHEQGTRYQIHVEEDGLLFAGEKGSQLTWMDAKIGDNVITPRVGKAVEVNALWYNALKIMEFFSDRFGFLPLRDHYSSMADLAKKSFNHLFWNPELECLYDVIQENQGDPSIRPNQIFSISLPFPILKTEHHRPVLKIIEQELLTPYGLRSLSPQNPKYTGKYSGNAIVRDKSYHQGTVWPWLLGPYVTSFLKVHGRTGRTLDKVKEMLEPFRDHLYENGIGTISELFDGDAPHEPNGCISQAWSVAEILRVVVEELK